MTRRISTQDSAPAPWTQTRWCLTCGLLALALFVLDLSIPLGVAAGVPYIAVVLLSLKSHRSGCTIGLAILCTLLTIAGFAASPNGGHLWQVLANRALALSAIWVTTALGLVQRAKDRELSAEHLLVLQADQEREVQEERLQVLRATMRTVQDIVGNFLTNLQLFQMEAEDKNALPPESLEMMNSIIHDTSTRLAKLGDLDAVHEKQMAGGLMGIEYDTPPPGTSTRDVPASMGE